MNCSWTLEANDKQLDFPILYGIARQGIVVYDPKDAERHRAVGAGDRESQEEPLPAMDGLDITAPV